MDVFIELPVAIVFPRHVLLADIMNRGGEVYLRGVDKQVGGISILNLSEKIILCRWLYWPTCQRLDFLLGVCVHRLPSGNFSLDF